MNPPTSWCVRILLRARSRGTKAEQALHKNLLHHIPGHVRRPKIKAGVAQARHTLNFFR